eukprot:CAMPEP_0179469504 /NCGR_PEP_ID=MMETSP0799-20121207/50174_1 /TAXON_ID=46947 /ORGANISM="Geminigera cryophila, Strain CCMP2564" /LENGTH=46 /DNA_ID= /DNA_START= /DNA_END= /DNA_ORIENTATION=
MNLKLGKGDEPDAFNTVYIYDTVHFPFHRAERYLQFKNSPKSLREV